MQSLIRGSSPACWPSTPQLHVGHCAPLTLERVGRRLAAEQRRLDHFKSDGQLQADISQFPSSLQALVVKDHHALPLATACEAVGTVELIAAADRRGQRGVAGLVPAWP